ncbi:MAG: VOC family protein [Bryobacteraceae bacterium]
MFSNGNATIFVSDMDQSVNFYTKILGLKLAQRFGNHWASVEAGNLTIGLHPASNENQAGKDGSTVIGLELASRIEDAIATTETARSAIPRRRQPGRERRKICLLQGPGRQPLIHDSA